MGTIITRRSKSGASRYTAQIRLKSDGKVVHTESETFGTAALAREWLRRREAELDGQRARGETFGSRMTVGQMITWYEGKEDAGDPWSRTKRADLKKLRLGEMADKRADRLTPADFIAYIRARREGGAGPSTAGNDLVWLGQVFKAVRIELRVPVPHVALAEASEYLWKTRIVAKPKQRDRRLREGEEAKILAHFESRDVRATIPMRDIVLFALATARREAEITRLLWEDLDRKQGICLLRDVKHPTRRQGNHKSFRLLTSALEIIERQPRVMVVDAAGKEAPDPRIFPFNPKSIGTAFTNAMPVLGIEDLHFHDLRHEATSRLFEAGYTIPEVAQFTLHESWATLKRYTHLRPENVAEKPAYVPPAG